MPTTTIYNMDVLEGLAKLPSDSVDCIVTSPPYYGLRDYGIEGQIGLEATYHEYINKMLRITWELKRVLKPTGTFWFNIGDTYAGSGNGFGGKGDPKNPEARTGEIEPRTSDIPTKSLMMIPQRMAIKMIDEQGWILRNNIIWNKPNAMPSPVTDRFTNDFEHIFFFVKSKKYWFKQQLESFSGSYLKDKRPAGILRQRLYDNSKYVKAGMIKKSEIPMAELEGKNTVGRNKRAVWDIITEPYPEAHFACFPKELPKQCIKAGCPEEICSTCGKPKEAIIEKPDFSQRPKRSKDAKTFGMQGSSSAGQAYQEWRNNNPDKIIGYKPTCICNTLFQPGMVLDPFAGSGTTLQAAKELGMGGIGIEINPSYVNIIKKRLHANELLNREEFKVLECQAT